MHSRALTSRASKKQEGGFFTNPVRALTEGECTALTPLLTPERGKYEYVSTSKKVSARTSFNLDSTFALRHFSSLTSTSPKVSARGFFTNPVRAFACQRQRHATPSCFFTNLRFVQARSARAKKVACAPSCFKEAQQY